MPNGLPFCTKLSEDGVDIGKIFVDKDYLIEVYPQLTCNFKSSLLLGWGSSSSGALGRNNSYTINAGCPAETVSGGGTWCFVATGPARAAGIKTDGTLWIWGSNFEGVLGNNTSSGNRSSPIQTISSGTNWRKVAFDANGSAGGIKSDGTLWMWGNSTSGALGNNLGGFNSRSSPVQTTSGGTNWACISGGAVFFMATKTDGTLWVWGGGDFGKLGTNSTATVLVPTQTVSSGNNWKKISAFAQNAMSIKTDGTLWLWGRGYQGSLGNNSTTDRSSPVQTVAGGTDWKTGVFGGTLGAAIKNDGTLWIWGCNSLGALGDNTSVSKSSPVQTISGGSNWRELSAQDGVMRAIKTDGSLWAWGFANGQLLGNRSYGNFSSPVQTVVGGRSWKNLEINSSGNSFAICESGNW